MQIKQKIIFACLLVFTFSSTAKANETTNLTDHIEFFKEKESDYVAWMHRNELTTYINLDSITVTNQVNLWMSTPDWDQLNNQAIDQGIDLKQLLVTKALFCFDLTPQEVFLSIEDQYGIVDIQNTPLPPPNPSPNPNPSTENIGNYDLQVEVHKNKGVSDHIAIDIGELNILSDGNYTSSSSVKAVKRELAEQLEKYFKENEARFEDYKFVAYDLNKSMVFEVQNVVSLVLEDEDYFEYLRLQFDFTKSNSHVQINYTLDGKYASGIIWSPKLSAYYDMDGKYSDELNRYNNILKSEINKILTN